MSSEKVKKTSLSSGDNMVYVTNKYSKTALDQNDMLLLAIKMSCQKRTELTYSPALKSHPKIAALNCVTVETKNHSALILIASTGGANTSDFADQFSKKLTGVLKSAHEKVYFVESFILNVNNLPAHAFLSAMGHYTFTTQEGNREVLFSYIKNEKQNDNDRFMPVSLDLMPNETPTENDLYLYLKRNNRYIKYIKQGLSLTKRIRDRLTRRGIHDLYMQVDQSINIQQQKAIEKIDSLLKDFYRID